MKYVLLYFDGLQKWEKVILTTPTIELFLVKLIMGVFGIHPALSDFHKMQQLLCNFCDRSLEQITLHFFLPHLHKYEFQKCPLNATKFQWGKKT